MKIALRYLLLVCLCLTGTTLYAQTGDTLTVESNFTNYTLTMDSLLQGVDKNRIPFGVLYDRVCSFGNLSVDQSDNDSIGMMRFKQALSEFQRSDYAYSDSAFPFNYKVLRDFTYSENRKDTIPVFVLNARFASIDSNALADSTLVKTGGVLYDGPNTSSPYRTHAITYAVMGQEMYLDTGIHYTLHFREEYEFGNDSLTVSSVTFYDSLTSEGWTVYPNSTSDVVFTVPGKHVLNVSVELSDNSVVNTKAIVSVKPSKVSSGPCESMEAVFYADIPFQGYDESFPDYGKGEFKIYYSTQSGCTGIPHKPVIILDGFDPLDERKIHMIHDERLIYGTNDTKLASDLRADGYDVVILNFPVYNTGMTGSITVGTTTFTYDIYRDGGTDYIERNSFVLVKLIDYLNDILTLNGSTEKLVIVGPSMGGLISRYALKYMENNSMDHNTRLWVSFDSPHHGANVSLGFQEMIRVFWQKLDNESAKTVYLRTLRSPAARQLLISQTNFSLGLIGMPTGAEILQFINYANNQDPFRIQWRNTLNSIGFPTQLRKVAMVNGSWIGGTYHPQGGKMFDVFAYFFWGLLPVVHAAPYFTNTNVSTLTEIHKSVLGLQQFHHVLNFGFNHVYGPLDAVNGGLLNIQNDFYEEANDPSFFNPLAVSTIVTNLTQNTCFIPTVSGLAMNNPNFAWSTELNRSAILCDNQTPFDNVYIPRYNEDHTDLTEDNVRWFKEELEEGEIGCAPICATIINGSRDMIVGNTYVYSLNTGLPSTAHPTWGCSANLQIMAYTNTTVTVKLLNNSLTPVVTCDIINDCGANTYLSRSFLINTPRYASPEDAGINVVAPLESTIQISPNPANKEWNVAVTGSSEINSFSATLTDIKGQTVWTYTDGNTPTKFAIDNHNLAPGTYILKLKINDEVSSHKVSKS